MSHFPRHRWKVQALLVRQAQHKQGSRPADAGAGPKGRRLCAVGAEEQVGYDGDVGGGELGNGVGVESGLQ